MAIKIVGEDDSIKKRVSCKNCAAIIEFLPIDTKLTLFEKEESYFYTVECPRCNEKNKLKENR